MASAVDPISWQYPLRSLYCLIIRIVSFCSSSRNKVADPQAIKLMDFVFISDNLVHAKVIESTMEPVIFQKVVAFVFIHLPKLCLHCPSLFSAVRDLVAFVFTQLRKLCLHCPSLFSVVRHCKGALREGQGNINGRKQCPACKKPCNYLW
ncbi:hypothetical protein ACFX2C_009913 [Malus domestica]